MTLPKRVQLSLLSAIVMVVGCDQSSSDMGQQPKAVTHSASVVFSDNASERPDAAGTIARDSPVLEDQMPSPITRDILERGQQAFDINCASCHGRLGNGDGIIVRRGFTRPPSFHVPRLRAASDRHFVDVITNGYGAMFGVADRVPPETRWAIVAYIRALQTAADANSALSPSDRATLLIGGDPNPDGGSRK